MDQEANTTVPLPTFPNNTWPVKDTGTPNPFNGYTCAGCGAWVTYGFYHQCPGNVPGQVITSDGTGVLGMMADLSMYGDFIKLLRRDTLQEFKDLVVEKLLDIEQETPGDVGFGIDVIVDVFDDVAKTLRDKSSV